MGAQKRKEGPGGAPVNKSTQPASSESRPSKRPKSNDAGNNKAGAKGGKQGNNNNNNKSDKPAPPAPSAPATSSLLKEEEPMFPRGGASVLTPLEYKQIQVQAKSDALFEEQSGKAAGKKGEKEGKQQKKSKKRSKGDDTPAKPDEDAVKIESLNFKRLVKGSMVLGSVCAINSLDIAVALPNNIIGHVPITQISAPLTKRLEATADAEESDDENDDDVDLESLFQIGQYVRAYVVSTVDEASTHTPGKAKRHIELSLQPSLANSGMAEQDVVVNSTVMAAIASVEDHGYVMDIEIADSKLQGFLARKQVDKSIPQEALQPGAVLLCIVTKSPKGKVVQLSTLGETIGNIENVPSAATTIDTFLPGTAADVLISEVSSHGVVGKIMGSLDVTADLVHSGAGPDGVDLEDTYKVGSRLKARVICNFPTAKNPKLGISVLKHVTTLTPKTASKDDQSVVPLQALPHSTIVEKCTVKQVEPEIGLYVDVGVEGVSGFVHISRVKDGKVDALFENSGPYKVGSVHAGRIVGYNAFDGMYLISLEKSVLEQPFLRIEDIPIGAVVSGVVEKMVVNAAGVGGLIVKIADGISGLVPEMHFADVHLQNPEKKFREGLKVKARVLSTDAASRQIRLTLKKTLVNSDLPAIQSYEQISVGQQALGTIINVLQHGAIVQFYGRLRGFLPVSEMSEAYIFDPKEHFRVGQTVSIYVISFDPDAAKLIVSCKDPSAFGLEKQLALKKLQIGDVVSAKVTQKTDDDVFVELADSGLKAILPVAHLTDKSVSKTQSALKKIHVNQTLPELVILEKNEARRSIILSQKPSLVKAGKEGKFLTTLDGARVGDEVSGYVRNITATAVFVQFGGKLTALLPKSMIPKGDQDKPDFGMFKSQSLTVKVTSVNNELQRLVVAIPGAGEQTKKVETKGEKLANPVDESITSLDDISIGKLTKARVVSVKDTQLNVQLADNIQGRIDVSQVYDSWDEIKDTKKPLKKFQPKQVVSVRVLGVHDARNHRFLPISHRSSHSVLELSAKPSDVKDGAAPEPLSFESLEVGSSYVGFVNNVGQGHLWVNLSPTVRGRVNAMEASDDVSLLTNLAKNFPIGSALRVRVVSVDAASKRLDLSAKSPGSEEELTWDKIKQDLILVGKVTKVDDRQVIVKLSESLAGPVHKVDLADDYEEANPAKFGKNEIIRVAVVEVDKSNKRIRLSTRPSRILNSSLPVKDKEVTQNTKLEVGDLVRGFVKNVSDKGLFVTLGGNVTAFVQIKNLSDAYLKYWKEQFQVDQLVKGRIISVSNGRIEMSLKPSVVDKDYVPLTKITDLKEGEIVTGRVRKVEEFGAFIDIDGSDNLSGLCHRSEMSDKTLKDARKLYEEGDKVKAKVLKVDVTAKRINLGLKPSYFGEQEDEDEMNVDEEVAEDSEAEDSDEEMSDADGAVQITGTDNIEEDSEDEDEASDVEMADASDVKGLEAGGFDWSASLDDGEKADASAADLEALAKKKKARREPQINVDKTASLDVNGPQTASDYERLLLGQPDSSQLWIAYMAFQMQVSDLAAARQVAERAIKTINIKEEVEKLNVWIAYLNLEVAYGNEETVNEVFTRACTYNDKQEVHERMASIYIQSGKRKEADDLFEKIVKEFGYKSPEVWVNYAHFLHTTAHSPDRARALLKRATQVLGKETHMYLALLPKFAALEFRSPNGDKEQGRTLFENLLATYPKKFDLWNQLIDLETSAADADKGVIRDLFDRGSKVKGLKPRQAKAWFKRWAQWEEKNGDKKSRERVSAKAQEWARTAAERKKTASAAAQQEEEESDEE